MINVSGVFFHLEELHSVIKGINYCRKDDGVLLIQFMYAGAMIDKLLSVLPKNEDNADALALAISAHHIGYGYIASNLQPANNSLDIVTANVLFKETKQ